MATHSRTLHYYGLLLVDLLLSYFCLSSPFLCKRSLKMYSLIALKKSNIFLYCDFLYFQKLYCFSSPYLSQTLFFFLKMERNWEGGTRCRRLGQHNRGHEGGGGELGRCPPPRGIPHRLLGGHRAPHLRLQGTVATLYLLFWIYMCRVGAPRVWKFEQISLTWYRYQWCGSGSKLDL